MSYHRRVSLAKSIFRLIGCAAVVASGSFVAFAFWFGLAEICGILEEFKP